MNQQFKAAKILRRALLSPIGAEFVQTTKEKTLLSKVSSIQLTWIITL